MTPMNMTEHIDKWTFICNTLESLPYRDKSLFEALKIAREFRNFLREKYADKGVVPEWITFHSWLEDKWKDLKPPQKIAIIDHVAKSPIFCVACYSNEDISCSECLFGLEFGICDESRQFKDFFEDITALWYSHSCTDVHVRCSECFFKEHCDFNFLEV